MKVIQPSRRKIHFAIALVASCLFAASAFAVTPPAKSKPVAKPVAPAPTTQKVTYPELQNHIGADVIIHTTMGTLRSGKLSKFTNSAIVVHMPNSSGGYDLEITFNTVKDAAIVIPPPAAPVLATPPPTAAPAPTDAKDRAKKN
jgi:hypothetical protein